MYLSFPTPFCPFLLHIFGMDRSSFYNKLKANFSNFSLIIIFFYSQKVNQTPLIGTQKHAAILKKKPTKKQKISEHPVQTGGHSQSPALTSSLSTQPAQKPLPSL